MAGKFEIYEDKSGEFRFRLKASNGENLLASEGYKAKKSALNGVRSVQQNCNDDACFDRKTTSSGKYRFNLKAKNHQIIGTSQNYDSEGGRDNGIAAISRAANDAQIVDLTKS